jgi:hypothetical protein
LGRYWFPNSWDTDWGLNGWGYVTVDEMKWLLSQQGDVTVPNLVVGSIPTPPPTEDADHVFADAAKVWLNVKGFAS